MLFLSVVELIGLLLNSIAAGAPVFIQLLQGFLFGFALPIYWARQLGEAGCITTERTGWLLHSLLLG